MAFWPKKDELLHLKFFQRKSNGLHFITHLEWTRQALLREQGETWLPEIASAPPKTKKHPCSRSYHGPLPQISLLQEDSKPKSQVLHFPKRLTTQHFFFFPVSASEIGPSPFPYSGAQSSNPVRKVPSRRTTSSPSLLFTFSPDPAPRV